MNYKIFLPLIFSIFLFSGISAMTVYSDFTSGSQSATIDVGDSISFNVDFFSMNPPMTSMKAGIYSGDTLYYSFLDASSSQKTYYNTYTYVASLSGTYKIRVIGTDKINTDSEFLTLIVNYIPPVNHAPVITSVPISQVNEGQSYSYDVQATDADSDTLTYSLTEKPVWLSINSATGLISGVAPLVSSNTNFDVTVKVSDGTDFDTQTYVLTVKNIPCPHINHDPVITSSPITSITEGNIYTYDVQATDSDGDDLTYSIIDAPGWLHINSNSGIISGTAPLVSSDTNFDVEVEVSDGNGGIDTQSYTLKVKNHVSGGTSSGIRVISDSDIYYQNRYFDQFETGQTVYTEKPTREVLGLSVSTFFYFLTAVISLGIIIVIYLLFKNIRR